MAEEDEYQDERKEKEKDNQNIKISLINIGKNDKTDQKFKQDDPTGVTKISQYQCTPVMQQKRLNDNEGNERKCDKKNDKYGSTTQYGKNAGIMQGVSQLHL